MLCLRLRRLESKRGWMTASRFGRMTSSRMKSRNRSTPKEVMEAVVLSAQREHEEKKLKYQGRLLASIAF